MEKSINPLLEILDNGLEHTTHKWLHYLPLYHKYFKKYKKEASSERKIKILEIGVSHGGSLDLWNEYFGSDNCEIYGVDINEKCRQLETGNIKIFIGDQGDPAFLNSLKKSLPPLDILIDDGGHTMIQQINTFDVLYDHVKPGGMYLCEDTHTSYWPEYGGGLANPCSFIEFAKRTIDRINGYHYNNGANYITYSCSGIYIHDSMVFFEKSSYPINTPHAKVWTAKTL